MISERYRLERLLDVGGMGEVWAARNVLTQKNFAVKFLLPELAERPDALERFIREAETAGSLEHPSIVDVFDVAQGEDGRPYIVMELLAGESLEARVERLGPITSFEAAAFIAQIADALDVAHRAGVVHRDLSVANIFLVRDPEGGRPVPKILDFGVSKTLGPNASDRTQTGNGAVLGCPEFMSPEQARGAESVDARTDVWSIGAVLYYALTGTAPFKAKNYNAMMVAILTRPHRPILEVAPSVDRELAALIEACLVKDRSTRIQTAREAADRLGAMARRMAKPAGTSYAPRRRATDRLPASDRKATGALPFNRDELRALSRLRPRAGMVGMTSAIVGVAVGALLALWYVSSVDSSSPPSAPPAPAAASSAPRPPAETRAPSTRVDRLPDDEPSLTVAVARGLGLGKNRRRP
jgi:eukaryotic-like serine/threonine-protein kinase